VTDILSHYQGQLRCQSSHGPSGSQLTAETCPVKESLEGAIPMELHGS